MTRTGWRDLVTETLVAPRVAAARLIVLDLPRPVLWQALVLVIVLNALAFHLGILAAPPSAPLPPSRSATACPNSSVPSWISWRSRRSVHRR